MLKFWRSIWNADMHSARSTERSEKMEGREEGRGKNQTEANLTEFVLSFGPITAQEDLVERGGVLARAKLR